MRTCDMAFFLVLISRNTANSYNWRAITKMDPASITYHSPKPVNGFTHYSVKKVITLLIALFLYHIKEIRILICHCVLFRINL